jgi:DNA replication protein DnaC
MQKKSNRYLSFQWPVQMNKRKPIPPENERYIWQEAEDSCAICGDRDITTQDKHHIEFVSKGGGNKTDNLILVCSNCHRKIHAGVISESEVKDRKAWLNIRLRQPAGYCLLDKTFFENEGQKGESRILHLRTATWSFILKGNYIDRDQQDELLSLVEELQTFPGDSLLVIRGKPGCGKSALMRWLAYQLHLKGNTVLHMTDLHEDWRERIGKFSERRERKYFYVIADDIFRTEVILEALKAGDNYIAFTFIGTTRSNEDRHSELEGLGYKISCLTVIPPSENEKQRILKKLEQDIDYAEKITKLSAGQKQHLLNAPSMLVLMLHLSEGKPFHLIIEDVVMRLTDTKENPARKIFGVLCNFYRFGIIIPEEILILCLPY